jgi:hypothetical protein
MRDQNINVIMISQASSEHSVCFAIKSADTEKALAALNKRWAGCGSTGCDRRGDGCSSWVKGCKGRVLGALLAWAGAVVVGSWPARFHVPCLCPTMTPHIAFLWH